MGKSVTVASTAKWSLGCHWLGRGCWRSLSRACAVGEGQTLVVEVVCVWGIVGGGVYHRENAAYRVGGYTIEKTLHTGCSAKQMNVVR